MGQRAGRDVKSGRIENNRLPKGVRRTGRGLEGLFDAHDFVPFHGGGAESGEADTGSAGESVRELADYRIALAGGAFESFTVEDADVAALVLDQADALECACR